MGDMACVYRVFRRFFAEDDQGSLSVEAVLIFPMLLWVTIASFTFFESYKSAYTSQRANATIRSRFFRARIS